MFCPNCGKEMNDGAVFCSNCGWSKGGVSTKNSNNIAKVLRTLKLPLLIVFIIAAVLLGIKTYNDIENSKVYDKVYAYITDDVKVLHLTHDEKKGLLVEIGNGWMADRYDIFGEKEYVDKKGETRTRVNTETIEQIVIDNKITMNSCECMFAFDNLVDIKGIKNIDTSNCTNFYAMFLTSKIKNIDLNSLDMSKGENFSCMFMECEELENVDMSKTNMRNARAFNQMFERCKKLKNIKFGDIDMLYVQNMADMFWECESLQNVDLSNIHYENVKSINSIFYGCSSLKEIRFNNSEWGSIENDIDMGFADSQKQDVKIMVNNSQKEYNEFMTYIARVRLTPNNLSKYVDIKTEVDDSYYSNRVGNFLLWEMSSDPPIIYFEFKSKDNRYTFDDAKVSFIIEMQDSQYYDFWKHDNRYEYSSEKLSEGLTNAINLNINNGSLQNETIVMPDNEVHYNNGKHSWEKVFTGNYKVYDVTGFVNRPWQ